MGEERFDGRGAGQCWGLGGLPVEHLPYFAGGRGGAATRQGLKEYIGGVPNEGTRAQAFDFHVTNTNIGL